MKCPKCGEETEEGYFTIYAGLRCAAINYWSVEKPKHRFFADPKIPQDSIEVMWTKKGKNVMQGFRCANCKLIMFEY